MKKPILLIGKNGQVSSAILKISDSFLENREIISLDSSQINLSIIKEKDIKNIFDKYSPALVINAAGYTNVDKAEEEKELCMRINGHALEILGNVCALQNIPLFHISTDYVFNGNGNLPWLTSDNPDPLTTYGRSKLLGEKNLQEINSKYLIFRVSWIFGNYGHNFVRTILKLCSEKDEIKIVSDQIGGPTSAESIAYSLLSLAESAISNISPKSSSKKNFPWGIYHLQGKPVLSWHEFAEIIIDISYENKLINKKPKLINISSKEFLSIARRPLNSRLECSLTIEKLGLKIPNWKDDLEVFVKNIKNK